MIAATAHHILYLSCLCSCVYVAELFRINLYGVFREYASRARDPYRQYPRMYSSSTTR